MKWASGILALCPRTARSGNYGVGQQFVYCPNDTRPGFAIVVAGDCSAWLDLWEPFQDIEPDVAVFVRGVDENEIQAAIAIAIRGLVAVAPNRVDQMPDWLQVRQE